MTPKHEIAYQFIKKRILDGYYGEGYRLVADNIARELNCSIIPIRESIRRLEVEGLVEHIPNVGASVIRIDSEGYAHALSTMAVLEGYATSIASPHMTTETFDHLRQCIVDMEEAFQDGDIAEFDKQNRKFHHLTCEKCENTYILEFIQNIRTKLSYMRKTVFPFIPGRGKESIEEHQEILRLLETKASQEEIEKYVREHKLKTRDAFIKFKKTHDSNKYPKEYLS